MGLEIADTGANGPSGGFWNLVLLKNADHIIFDRCWIHGSPAGEDIKGIVFEASSYIAIVDSFISDIHSKTSANGADSSAIGSVTGIGPVKIVNNFIEAAGENVLWGGGRADTHCPTSSSAIITSPSRSPGGINIPAFLEPSFR